MKTPLAILAVLAAGTHFAMAEVSTQGIVDNLQANGFANVEIKVGPTQVKAEGYSADGTKIEVIYDRTSGKIMNQETHRVRVGEDMAKGVTVRTQNEDFSDSSKGQDDMYDDHGKDDHEDDHGMSDHGGSDHSGSDHESSDHESSDHESSDDSHDSGSDDHDSEHD